MKPFRVSHWPLKASVVLLRDRWVPGLQPPKLCPPWDPWPVPRPLLGQEPEPELLLELLLLVPVVIVEGVPVEALEDMVDEVSKSNRRDWRMKNMEMVGWCRGQCRKLWQLVTICGVWQPVAMSSAFLLDMLYSVLWYCS